MLQTRIFGTRGQLEGDGSDEIKVFDFVTRETTVINPSKESGSNELANSGHGGGDYELMQSFLYACCTGDDRYIISGARETFGKVYETQSICCCSNKMIVTDSHLYVFAAEHARRTGTVVDINEYRKEVLSEP